MASRCSDVSISATYEKRCIILLKSRTALGDRDWQFSGDAVQVLSVAPDTVLFSSDDHAPSDLIRQIAESMDDGLHHVVDYSSALSVIALAGEGARNLLSTGTSVNTAADAFSRGDCRRTRFAGIAVILVRADSDSFELYCDPSQSRYLHRWVRRSLETQQRIAIVGDTQC